MKPQRVIIYGEPKKPVMFAEKNNITPENTVLVIGCSPFIHECHQFINPLLKKYTGIACNCASFYFEGFEYIATNDFYPESNLKKIINWDKNFKEIVEKRDCHYIFKPNIEEPILEDVVNIQDDLEIHELYGRHTVSLPAINFSFLKGFENAVLIGVDLSAGWNHFYEKPKSVNLRQSTSARLRLNRMQLGFKLLSEHINIYNVNPEARTGVPIIGIETL